MSGIAGIIAFDNPASTSGIDSMLDAMKHRGPNHVGIWQGDMAALGCRHLPTTPESSHQRLPFVDGDLAITADARLDNRAELIAQLSLPTGTPDSALILEAYRQWGRDCAAKLLGDFAFAIWDAGQRSLFCARDHFGVRPFYYCHTSTVFAFASEIGALLSIPEVPRRVDDTHLLEYLAFYSENFESTFYRDIRRLPPAHTLTVDNGDLSTRRYWSLDPDPTLRLKSDQEYGDAFRTIFQEAVQCRLRTCGMMGSTLSGGLDSSSIVCTARNVLQNHGESLHTFSVIFDDVPASDERSYMQAVIDTGGLDPHFVRGDLAGPLDDIDDILRRTGGPFLGSNLFLHRLMYRAAAESGVGVLLDGLDGDTTLSHGVSGLTELAARGRWLTLVHEVRGFSRHFNASPVRVIRNVALLPFIPPAVRRAWGSARGRASAPSLFIPISADFRRRSDFEGRAMEIAPDYPHIARTEKEAHLASLSRGILPRMLELTDVASAAFSIETRYPFYDKRLIEFCLSVPPHQKIRRGWSRWIMRQGMEGTLPPAIQWREGKADLAHNFTHTLRTRDMDRLDDMLDRSEDRLADYVDMDQLRVVRARFLSGNSGRDAQSIMQVAILGKWLKDSGL